MAIHPLVEDRGFTPFHAAQMAEKAKWAAQTFSTYDRAAVLKIAEAVANAAHKNARRYAECAAKETGYGIADHATLRNEAASKGILERHRDEDFSGIRLVPEAKIVEIQKPRGVIFATTPATDAIGALYGTAILCLLTRNAVIFSPHAAAMQCSVDAARLLAKVAEDAGAPDGTIQVIDAPNHAGDMLIKPDRIDLSLSLEVAANIPVYVDDTANFSRAARAIVESKSFDYGIGFGSESAIIAHAAIADRLREEFSKQGCHVCSDTERDKLERLLFPLAKFDANWIGKPASAIAAKAGFRIPSRTKLLIVPLMRVGDDYPLSREKPCPVLGFYVAASRDSAMSACRAMVRGAGGGDCAMIHCEDAAMILRFGAEMPVSRVSVNASVNGSATHLAPLGGLSPKTLVRRVAMAWSRDASVKMPSLAGVGLPRPDVIGRPPRGEIDYDFGNPPPGAAKQTAKPSGKSRGKVRT